MGIDIDNPDIMIDEIDEALLEFPLNYNERLAVSCEEEEVFKSRYFSPLTEINEHMQFDIFSPDIEDNMQEAAQNAFQEQSGEDQVFESSCLEMVKEEQTMGLEFHEIIETIPIVLQEVQENYERYQLQIQPTILSFVEIDLFTSSVFQSDFQEYERSLLFPQDEKEIVITFFYALETFHDIVQVKVENISEVDPICQEEVKWHDCHYLLANFLQTSQKMVFVLFMKTKFGFRFSFKLQLQYQVFVCYEHNREARVLDQLIDWLYWNYHIT